MPTKIADVTVGADGTWSSGPHTLASGARSVTLRRKSDGAVLATRSFTVQDAHRLVAISSGASRAMTSDDGGATWSTRAALSGSLQVGLKIACAGDRLVVPCGNAASSQNCWVSEDRGVTWTYGANMPSSQKWRSVAWNGSVFCAVAYNTSKSSLAATSPDGVTWTARTLPGTTDYWYSVTAHGSRLVALATSSTKIAVSDDDGANWTLYALPSSTAWRDVVSNGAILVAMSSGGVATSDDGGATWTARTVTDWSGGYTVAWNGSAFCVVGAGKSYTSSDGVTWTTTVQSGWNVNTTAVYASGGRFFAVQSGASSSAAYYSDDGVSWSPVTLPYTNEWAMGST